MKKIYSREPIRVPVRFANGKWEYFYGRTLPVKDGTIGDLLIDKSSIEDDDFLSLLKRRSQHKILETGTNLLVALTIKSEPKLGDELMEHLLPIKDSATELGDAFYFTSRSPDTRLLQITIDGPTDRQKRTDPNEKGGVWLNVEGLQAKGVSTSTVKLPDTVLPVPAESLNHAFTLLSEKYEPWRKSHTGNIYDRMLYQEKNQQWYPLEVLRNAPLATAEHQHIKEQWSQISQELSKQITNEK